MPKNKIFRSIKTSKPNMSSMTDVAFLVIIFFWVTTSIPTEKGTPMTLPRIEKTHRYITRCGESAFLLRILINNQNKILINEEESSISEVREIVIKYIIGSDKSGSGRHKAVVSIKGDRGTNFSSYIKTLDQIKAAYTFVRAKEIGWSEEKMLHFPAKQENATQEDIKAYNNVVFLYPMVISEADATEIEKNNFNQ